MPQATMSLQILPIVDESEIYPLVDQVIEVIRSTGLNYVVGPMETSVEGDLDTLFTLAKQAQQVCVQAGAERVISIIKIDYKPGGVTIDEKIRSYR